MRESAYAACSSWVRAVYGDDGELHARRMRVFSDGRKVTGRHEGLGKKPAWGTWVVSRLGARGERLQAREALTRPQIPIPRSRTAINLASTTAPSPDQPIDLQNSRVQSSFLHVDLVITGSGESRTGYGLPSVPLGPEDGQ